MGAFFKVVNTVLLSTVFLSVSLLPHTSSLAQAGLASPQKGMSYVTWDRTGFSSRFSDESLVRLAELGVEYIAVCITWYQDRHDSTDIRRTDRTPTIRSTRHLINKAHSLGLKVMLKPHVDLIDKIDGTYWRGDIGFYNDDDWNEWFDNYNDYILRYARLAERMDVALFCVGTELAFASQKTEKWRELISEVRDIYSGEIVYAANWDEYKSVKFWDDLDYVGIDAYFPLTYENSPTVEDLKKGWNRWINEIESWLHHQNVDRQVIFTEIGYASTPHAPSSPWQGGTHGNAEPEIQEKCYRAFFETVWHKPWLAGVYWWKWNTNKRAGGVYNRQFTPQNKPAERVLEISYNTPYSKKTDLAMNK